MLVVGDREQEENTVSVRQRDSQKTQGMKVAEFVEHITSEIYNKK